MRTRILHRWKTVFLGDYWEYFHCRHRQRELTIHQLQRICKPEKNFKMVSLVYFCIGEYIACLAKENGI